MWMARRNGASGDEQRLVGALAREPGQRGLEPFEVVVVEERRVREDVRHVGVTQQPPQLAGLGERVHRHEHRTHPRDRERGDDEVGAVRHQDPDA